MPQSSAPKRCIITTSLNHLSPEGWRDCSFKVQMIPYRLGSWISVNLKIPGSPTLMARGPLELQLSCGKRVAFNGETQARINILVREATALNGETQARINILTWDASMKCERGAALNGKT